MLSTIIQIGLCLGLASLCRSQSSREPLGQDFNFIGNSFGIAGTNASFDYVVVGGGTAGLTIATRLAQAHHAVAVVEAGGFYEMDNGNLSVIPANAGSSTGTSPGDFNPLIDWGFVTTPQTAANDRAVHYARGKTLGGSSARNYMVYQRGASGAYDIWANDVGDDSYRFDNWKPYFDRGVNFTLDNNMKRAQNATVPPPSLGAFSSQGGPLHVSYPNWGNPFSSWGAQGLAELGLQYLPDFVSGKVLGMQYGMMTLDPTQEIRDSSEAYLRVALDTSLPVTFYKNTLARKIIFDENRAATGVLVQSGPKIWILSARNEVILSAGVFQSPQLLMVSGVGPEDLLSAHGIDIVSNLPGVGQNMWEQLLYGPSYAVKNILTHTALSIDPAYAAAQLQNYIDSQDGPLGNSGGDFFAFEKLPQSDRSALSNETLAALQQFPDDWPELQYVFSDAYRGSNSAPDNRQYATPQISIVAPLSRGNVSITSSDTNDPPVINPNWLVDPADQELAVAGFKRARALMQTKAMAPIVDEEVFPGRNASSNEDILDNIRSSCRSFYHACCTNKMGEQSHNMTVIDSNARVFGVKNLRVVDISSFPLLPPGQPQSVVYALAEKIADLIVHSH